jgi:hypothetical protein
MRSANKLQGIIQRAQRKSHPVLLIVVGQIGLAARGSFVLRTLQHNARVSARAEIAHIAKKAEVVLNTVSSRPSRWRREEFQGPKKTRRGGSASGQNRKQPNTAMSLR